MRTAKRSERETTQPSILKKGWKVLQNYLNLGTEIGNNHEDLQRFLTIGINIPSKDAMRQKTQEATGKVNVGQVSRAGQVSSTSNRQRAYDRNWDRTHYNWLFEFLTIYAWIQMDEAKM